MAALAVNAGAKRRILFSPPHTSPWLRILKIEPALLVDHLICGFWSSSQTNSIAPIAVKQRVD
jgi:hypothetical protein